MNVEAEAAHRAARDSALPVFVITTLAQYQTVFWKEVGKALMQRGGSVAFLCFDDRSFEDLRGSGFEVYNIFALAQGDHGLLDEDEVRRLGLQNLNLWLSHERVTFRLTDTTALKRKFAAYLRAVDHAMAALSASGRPQVLIQELGGFVSVVAAYHAARARGIDNWFIEPAFFRGRLLFIKNSFAALAVADPGGRVHRLASMDAYLEQTLELSSIVIPGKDKHQYRAAARKVLDMRNARRLILKCWDKYILGKHQEFGHIWTHSRTHLQMASNALRLRWHYTPLALVGPFIYFPLHVPADMALTVRSPEYLDQLAVIDFLARTIPHTHKLVIKEHPAQVGAVDLRRLLLLLRQHDNLAIVKPTVNNFAVIRASDVVVTINSKSGAEALLLEKPTVVLGDSFYRPCRVACRVDRMAHLPDVLRELVEKPPLIDTDAVREYFQRIWDVTRPGELYVTELANIDRFTESLMSVVDGRGTELKGSQPQVLYGGAEE